MSDKQDTKQPSPTRLRQGYGAAGIRMNRAAQVTPIFRKTADTFAVGAKKLEQKYFVSLEIFAQEQAKIFSKQWVLVGHQSQIVKPGDYFVAEVAGESLIVSAIKAGKCAGSIMSVVTAGRGCAK